ncbi:hypothetical protein COLO4_09673 [Corchorus olitorius]|uniref:Uncharacterized protein n=1 Tax=Corchorus olitorius TaxID=93759 RepID=A0A1R3KBH9_9ROSI|nr:hypothetical protein COLO4_09673 [Corchorus olitorius]
MWRRRSRWFDVEKGAVDGGGGFGVGGLREDAW